MKTVAITGAGGGIGQALALHYLEKGWQVLGFDCSENGLLETHRQAAGLPGRFRASILDLGNRGERHRLIEIVRRRGGVDLFVHNAAINRVGHFEDMPFGRQQQLIDLNITAPMTITRALLAENLLKERATLVFLSSLSWFVGYPGASVYAGTKDALAHYARSLRVALKPRGIHVLTVYPGPVRTPMASRCSPDGEKGSERRMPVEEIARRIAAAVDRRRPELVPGGKNQLIALVGARFPELTGWAMKRLIYDRLVRTRHPDGLNSDPPADR